MRYLHRVALLSLPICAAVLLSGCGSSLMSSSNSSDPSGAAPAVVAVGEQANGVAPNRWQYVQFNEPMDASTINSQTFVVADASGNPAPGTVTYNANFEIAGFQPNPALADNTAYTLTITTGVASAQGVHLAAPYTSHFTTRSDTDKSPIYVKSVTPFPDASCISASTPIVITFNEGADVSTINSSNILITGPGNTPIQAKMGYNAATATVTLTPTSPLPSGSITVYVNNVADAAGVKMTSPFMWSFLTTCSGGGGVPTTQFIATFLNDSGAYMVHGQVTIDTAGNTAIQLSGATPTTTYTVQFCPAYIPGGKIPSVPCFNITTISTDAGGSGTATAKFPTSGEWAGDFYVNDSAGKAIYQTYLSSGISNETYLAALLPIDTTNGGAASNGYGPQEPLQSGTVSYSNGSLQFTVQGASPNTTHSTSETETVYMDGSGSYGGSLFTTNAQGNGSLSTTLDIPGGDLFQVAPLNSSGLTIGDGFIGGFKVP